MSFLSDYTLVTQKNESPASYHLFSSLVAISGLISGKVWLDLGLFKIRPNLYVILTGPPGVKKTTAMSVTKRLLREVGHENVPLAAECQTKEALTQELASYQRVCQLTDGMVPRHFSPIDEARSKFLYSPITICVTEFSQFVGVSNAGHMLDFLTTIYDEEAYTNSTKGKGKDIIPMPYVSFLACTVPDWITARLKDDVISGGFSRRAIFVYETHSDIRIPIPEVTPEMEEAWIRVVQKAKHITKLKGPFEWGPGAKEFYCDWYTSLKRPADPLLDGWFNSVQIQMLKIAMLLAASEWIEGQHYITIQDMQDSIALLKEVEQNIPKVFKGVGRNELFGIGNKIVEMIQNSPTKDLPESLVKKDLFREANLDELNKIIQHLEATQTIKKVMKPHPITEQRTIFLTLCDISDKSIKTPPSQK